MHCLAYTYEVDKWHLIANEIKKRDHYRCQSCLRRFRMDLLTVHHIFARDQGGDDNPDNLIALCRPCHDEIEELGYMTVAEIHGFRAEPEEIASDKEEREEKESRRYIDDLLDRIDAERPSWHKYVYGGEKRTR